MVIRIDTAFDTRKIEIIKKDVNNFIRRLDNTNKFLPEQYYGLVASQFQKRARRRVRKDTRALMNEIKVKYKKDNISYWRIDLMKIPYAYYQEKGFTPHWVGYRRLARKFPREIISQSFKRKYKTSSFPSKIFVSKYNPYIWPTWVEVSRLVIPRLIKTNFSRAYISMLKRTTRT